jgi:hypothetical protein
MNRPTVEVADIVQAQGDRFVEQNRSWLSFQQLNVLRAIERCRTAALGGHVDSCPRCGHQAISYNSCRNRHCPKCQAQARQRWLAARDRELLGVPYFHVVFTLPHELNQLCQQNPEFLYGLLFQTSAATLLEVAANPKHLGAEIGFLSILHTWGQNLQIHPHVHCAIPAGGFFPNRTQWVHPPYSFFLPHRVLRRVFRGKFVAGLRRLYRQKKLRFQGDMKILEEPKPFAAFLRTVFRKDWVVYPKRAFGGPMQVLRYLGRYTHRVAISNHRLLAFDGERITFRWKDYAHGNKQRKITLTATEFLRRFVQHVLPRGFIRIRQYGFLANRCRAARLALARQLLAVAPLAREPCPEISDSPTWRCPHCGAAMQIGPNLTACELADRCGYFDSS